MESSTTDVCEWCKRPMLPEGATISAVQQAAPAQPETPPQEQPQAQAQAAEAAAAAEPPSEGLAELGSARAQPRVAGPEVPAEDVLRPLGQPPAAARGPGAPSHGLSDEATKTSVDVANYLAPGESLFRPLERPVHSAITSVGDPLARRISRRGQRAVSDIPDNVRLLRSLIAGLAISVPLTILQFLVTRKAPDRLYFLSLGSADSLGTALLYGLVSGAFLGFGLGAVLVQFKRGPFIGLLMGLVLGAFFLATDPIYYGIIAGCLTGIVVGRIATVGYRRLIGV